MVLSLKNVEQFDYKPIFNTFKCSDFVLQKIVVDRPKFYIFHIDDLNCHNGLIGVIFTFEDLRAIALPNAIWSVVRVVMNLPFKVLFWWLIHNLFVKIIKLKYDLMKFKPKIKLVSLIFLFPCSLFHRIRCISSPFSWLSGSSGGSSHFLQFSCKWTAWKRTPQSSPQSQSPSRKGY